ALLATRGGHPLVDLEEGGLGPGHLLVIAEDRQHPPRGAAAADGQGEGAALRDRLPSGGGDHGGLAWRRIPFSFDDPEPRRAHDDFSSWPPNCLRIAESTLSAKSSRPREEKRSYSAVVSTGVGTPSSIAAIEVQRPSPESETRPEKSERSLDC